MKPDLLFSILCDEIRIEHNGKFILVGLFDNIGAPSLPVVHSKFVVVNRWGKGEGKFREQSRIVDAQSGKVLAQSGEISFELPNLDTLHNVISEFKNVHFGHAGKYWVEILLDGELLRSYNFYVRHVKGQET